MSATNRSKPFENTRMAVFLRKRIDELASTKSQREIAMDAGYDKPNIISMFKNGETKIPFDKVPALAKALDTDVVQFLRLQLDQPNGFDPKTVQELMGRMTTAAEEAGVLSVWREITNGADPRLNDAQRRELAKALTSIMKPAKIAASN